MQCVILAGGLATRMRPLTEKIPKSLIEVAGKRPFVDYQLEFLKKQGIQSVVFCIGYKGQMLRDHIGDGAKWGLKASYADEGQNLMGTAGALRLAQDQGLLDEKFFVTYGDSFLPIDFRAVWQDFVSQNAPALMTVMENSNRWDQSNACYSQGQVVLYDKKINPKPKEMRFIDYGLSVLSASVVSDYTQPGRVADLATVFHQLSLEGKLRGFLVKERFYEVGSFQGLAEFETYQESLLALGN